MSYMHIQNLYKNQDILLFKECYALEKIHGTSAHISFHLTPTGGPVIYHFSGGVKYANFLKLFDNDKLLEIFKSIGVEKLVIYGEAYGGSCQKMSDTYGKELKFIVFEVKIGDLWLNVEAAAEIAKTFELEFVHFEKVKTDIEVLDKLASADSVQAVRNEMGPGKLREGVVLRPLIELTKNNGERLIAKHKNDKFKETRSGREVTPEKLEVLAEANKIAEEWVTEMRLQHVLNKFQDPDIKNTGDIIKAMIEDVTREAEGEIIDSKEAKTAIGKRTAALFKDRLRVI